MRRVVLLVAAACIAAVVASSPADANFGSQWSPSGGPPNGTGDSPSLANNKWHAVRPVDAPPGTMFWYVADAAQRGANQINGTDMSGYITYSDSAPDVWVYQDWIAQDFGPNYGLSQCPSGNSGWGSYGSNLMWCRGQVVKFYYNAPNFQGVRGWVGCHEIGHTVGLRHTSSGSSCMNTSNSVWSYSSHDIFSHINPFY